MKSEYKTYATANIGSFTNSVSVFTNLETSVDAVFTLIVLCQLRHRQLFVKEIAD